MTKNVEIKIDNHELNSRLLELARRSENLRPLMKNIAGIFAYSTEENFANEGKPDKWADLAESTKNRERRQDITPDKFYRYQGNLHHQ